MKNLTLVIIAILIYAGVVFSGNYSLDFDGVDDYVNIGRPLSLDAGNAGSSSLWFKISSSESRGVLFTNDTQPTNPDFGLEVEAGGTVKLHGYYYLQNSIVRTSESYDDGEWHHAVGIKMGYDGCIQLYVDNEFIGEDCTSPSDDFDHNDDYFIGAAREGGHDVFPFHGIIDEILVYDRVLTASEVSELFGQTAIIDESLVGYWELNEGEGDTAYDSSGDENHGTIYGAIWSEDVPHSTLEPFSLLLPEDGTVVTGDKLFDWEDSVNPDSLNAVFYNLYYAVDSFFTDPVIIDSLETSEYLLETGLDNFTEYFWKVRAYCEGCEEAWSTEVFTFLTDYPEAVIDIAPNSFDFALFVNDTALDTLLICNTGNISLDFDISWLEGWLFLEPSSGSVLPDSCMMVEVVCSGEDLAPGMYADTLEITSNSTHDPVITVPVSLEVVTPVITILECDYPIAPRGGYLEYRAGLANQTGESRVVDVWLDLYLLNGDPYPGNPFSGPITVTMGPYFEVVQERTEYVPYYAPLGGPYEICLRCGQYPTVWDETCFEFSVTPPPVE